MWPMLRSDCALSGARLENRSDTLDVLLTDYEVYGEFEFHSLAQRVCSFRDSPGNRANNAHLAGTSPSRYTGGIRRVAFTISSFYRPVLLVRHYFSQLQEGVGGEV
jgi:hypothetical protein